MYIFRIYKYSKIPVFVTMNIYISFFSNIYNMPPDGNTYDYNKEQIR